MSRTYDAERYAVLAAVHAKGGTEVSNESVGAYRTKVIAAGEMLYISCYPLLGSRDVKREQDLRLELMHSAIKDTESRTHWGIYSKYSRYNNKRRMREFEILCNANFGKNDLHITLTYDMTDRVDVYHDRDDYLSEDETKKHVRNWMAKVKRVLRRRNVDLEQLRWVWVPVKKIGVEGERHHHHLLMHGVPVELRTAIEELWEHGFCNADRLQPNGKGISEVANYVARQEGAANGSTYKRHSYSTSRNIIKPEAKSSDVKVSRRKVQQIAADVRQRGVEILNKIWRGYTAIEPPEVVVSDFTAGAYIYARMRRC